MLPFVPLETAISAAQIGMMYKNDPGHVLNTNPPFNVENNIPDDTETREELLAKLRGFK